MFKKLIIQHLLHIIIDRNTWRNIKPEQTMKRTTRFLSILSKICVANGLMSKSMSSEKLVKICKNYFSFVWKLYYEMQMPWLLGFRKLYGDLESFHIGGIIISSHALDSKKK